MRSASDASLTEREGLGMDSGSQSSTDDTNISRNGHNDSHSPFRATRTLSEHPLGISETFHSPTTLHHSPTKTTHSLSNPLLLPTKTHLQQSKFLQRRRYTGVAYIAIIFCYGLFLPSELSWLLIHARIRELLRWYSTVTSEILEDKSCYYWYTRTVGTWVTFTFSGCCSCCCYIIYSAVYNWYIIIIVIESFKY